MNVRREITVRRTARFHQLCGKFDLPNEATTVAEWDVNVALPAEWSVGVIVGPSGAGKTTLARELFGADSVIDVGHWPWPADACIGDGFPAAMSVDEIAGLLSSVGLSSPPDWKKPHGVLSNGQKFRVDLARTLAERPELAVVDEFGSLVHEQVRKVAASAAEKTVRRRGGRLVALCVHSDAVPYFEPDWIIDVQPGEPVRLTPARGLVRRPDTHLDVERCDRAAWRLFAPHHYLDGDLSRSAQCFAGFVEGQPACFTAVIYFPHASGGGWREHRTVCLPDYQGIGIGNAQSGFVASLFKATGRPYYSTTSHPAMIRHRARSPLWRMDRKPGLNRRHGGTRKDVRMAAAGSTSRITAGFTYVGPAAETQLARRLGVV